MAFIPTPNVARVALEATYYDADVVNTLWFSKASPYTALDLGTLEGLIETAWKTHILPLLNQNLTLNTIRLWAQDSDTAPSVSYAVTTDNTGHDASGQQMAANVAICVTHYTANRGRSGRGRTYLGGLGGACLTNAKTVASAWKSLADTAFSDFMTEVNAGDSTWCIVSHYHNNAARSTGLAQVITSSVVRARIDSQRRRLGV